MATADEADQKARVERARETGLFRYSLVQELLEPGLSLAERGWRAREMAARVHEGPGGRRVTVSYSTLTRWRRAYEEGGFDALVPSPRQPAPRTPEEVLALAEALKREKPGRTAAQVRRVLQVTSGWAPSDRTLQRLFERLELNRPAPGPEEEQRAFGRFECTRPNEMWTGDTLHGPVIGGAKSYLFAFVDDHSRAVMGARWAHHDDVVRMAAAFRPALQARGVPRACYLDNGSPFVDAWLLRGCAVLGVKLIHSRPGKPEGRGKIERFFRTVRDQFLVEVGDGAGVADLAEMNRLFHAWTRDRPTTGRSTPRPARPRLPGGRRPPRPSGPSPSRACCGRRSCGPSGARPTRRPWSACTATSTRSTRGWPGGRSSCCSPRSTWTGSRSASAGSPPGPPSRSPSAGTATPRPATPDWQPRTEPAPTGIDYLAALGDGHDAALREQVSYQFLVSGPREEPGKREEPEQEEGNEGGGRG